MMELVDTRPNVDVQPAEYQRLLGYPPDHEWSGRALELAAWARSWYLANGRPWVYAREALDVEIANGSIRIEGVPFHSTHLLGTFERAGAHGVMLVAAGAGIELEQEARRLWNEGKPDEYFFLEVFGSAAVEHLTHFTGARLCAWAEQRQMAVLPHYSPGYPEWDIAEQVRLLELIGKTRTLPAALEALDSGALRPKKSQLAVFGFTRHTDRVRRLADLIPCESCSFLPCQYRRASNAQKASNASVETFHFLSGNGNGATVARLPVLPYTVKTKALKRWANERLSLNRGSGGEIEAIFRYDGTTCANMGRPFTFLYRVSLGPLEQGYPVRAQHCSPAPGDTGHTSMCRYLDNAGELMAAIDRERPFLGKPLNAVLGWKRPDCAPGCYCEPSSREHKWGIVLETIHYALHQKKEP